MILVDTSIWIEFFKQNPDYTAEMESLLESRHVITLEPVFSELLYGARGDKDKHRILSYWKALPHIRFTEGAFLKAAEFANRNNYHNKGIGLMDALITGTAIDNDCKIWTLDKKIISNIESRFVYK